MALKWIFCGSYDCGIHSSFNPLKEFLAKWPQRLLPFGIHTHSVILSLGVQVHSYNIYQHSIYGMSLQHEYTCMVTEGTPLHLSTYQTGFIKHPSFWGRKKRASLLQFCIVFLNNIWGKVLSSFSSCICLFD